MTAIPTIRNYHGRSDPLMLISLIVPCYNEEEAMPLFYQEAARVAAQMEKSHGAEFEIIFVDDGSKDGTLRVARELHDADPRVRYVSFSRNFGKEAGIYAGLKAAKGDYVATLDADLQDPPALLPDMLDALIGVYERNVQGYPSTAVLPYSQALSRFPAHLQQCDMESNGKSVNRFGEPVDYVTGPVIFGEPGTNGQHSFYQLLHQGTNIVPLQFIGFKKSQLGVDVDIENSTSQQKLCANVAAQIVAFACGKEDENLNKNFKGGRPSSIIVGEELTPKSLGALLAHFENKIMFQGFVWNLNSFDQEGVQLGKVLAKRVLAHDTDGALKVYSDLLDI